MVEVKNLVKHYGDKRAVNDISFTVEKGEILGFLGPNGAGKSTTMNMLTGYISSTSGSVKINGKDILEEPLKAKAQIGYLPELPPLYLDMTVNGYLSFLYDLKKCKIPRRAHIKDICELTKIADVSTRIIKNLSKGYKQRVGLAGALIGNPPVLILDEPTVGLDPKQIIEIRTLIKKLGKNHTVILSSHILPEIQAVCDRVIIINKGEIVADDTEHNLSQKVSTDHRLTARIEGKKEDVIKAVKSLPNIWQVRADIEKEPNVYEYDIEAAEGVDIRRDLFFLLAEKKMPLLMLKSAALSLEDIFLKITMGNEALDPEVREIKKAKDLTKQLEKLGFGVGAQNTEIGKQVAGGTEGADKEVTDKEVANKEVANKEVTDKEVTDKDSIKDNSKDKSAESSEDKNSNTSAKKSSDNTTNKSNKNTTKKDGESK
jgi:ABC-2 type transport system ATP-binding protein